MGIVERLEFTTGGDAVGAEYQGYIVALLDRKQVGRLDYTFYEGELGVRMVEVVGPRRRGIATALLHRLKEDDPGVPVFSFGDVATEAGQAWLIHHGIERWSSNAERTDSA